VEAGFFIEVLVTEADVKFNRGAVAIRVFINSRFTERIVTGGPYDGSGFIGECLRRTEWIIVREAVTFFCLVSLG